MPVEAPEKAAPLYPGEAISLQGWVDAQTILAGDLQTLSWIGEDGTVKQTLSSADLYGKDQFGLSSGNTVRVHPFNPDLLPFELARLQVIDYSRPDEAAAAPVGTN